MLPYIDFCSCCNVSNAKRLLVDKIPTRMPYADSRPNLSRCDCIYCKIVITIMYRVGGPKET